MRHLLTRLAAAAFVAGLVFGLSPASAAPPLKLDGLVGQTNAVEDIGYRYHRYGHGWRHYNRYRYYGYGYRPYTGIGPITAPTGITGGRRQPLNLGIGGHRRSSTPFEKPAQESNGAAARYGRVRA